MSKRNKQAAALAAASIDDLTAEIYRRQREGELVALVITPDDLAGYWECDETGATSPASAVPTPEQMRAIRDGFDRWLDHGNYTDLMQVCRDAWNKGGDK